jgi:phospholipase/carboxylesterase
MQMRAWYDIRGINIDRDQDEQGIGDSIAQATALVHREQERGIDASRILLAGFSQGGAIAIQCALRYPEKLAGLVALSTYLLQEHRLEAERHESNQGIPVFYGHGSADPIVPVQLGKQAASRLEELGHPVEWQQYPMQHSVCPEEIQHLAAWMQKRF